MGQRPKALTPERSPQHRWGAELRAIRTERGLSLDELGRRIHRDRSYLAKLERGERSASSELAHDCDRALDTGGSLIRLHALSNASAGHGHGHSGHVANHRGHVASQAEEVAVPPSTPGAWETAEDEIAVPARTADGSVIFVAVSRRNFLRGVGSAAAGMAAAPAVAQATQISPALVSAEVHPVEHLEQVRRTLIDADNLFGPSQVIPTVHEKIQLIQQIRQSYTGADQKTLLRTQTQFGEFAGWLHQDAGDQQAAQRWLDRALQWSHGAGDPELTTFVLARKAQLAGDMADPLETVDAAEAAMASAASGSRLAAAAATFGAHGHALRGDRTAALRAYDHARELLAAASDGGWAPWLDHSYIDVARYRSQALVGDYQGAADGFQRTLAALPTGFHRDRGVYLARAAAAHAGAAEVDQAAALGLQALAIGVETRSGRILTELDGLNGTLAQTDAAPAREFREAMRDTLAREL